MNSTTSSKILPEVGDVYVYLFGYEAVLAVFVKVIKVTKASVQVVELEQVRNYAKGGMDWTCFPSDNERTGEERKHLCRVKHNEGGVPFFKVGEHTAYKWTGKEIHCYNYH